MLPDHVWSEALVTLAPVTKANWKAVAALTVHDSQRDWLPSNLYSIAEAQFYPDAQPRAILNDAGELVGFTLYGRDESSAKWKLFRLMIDAAHQRKGYGMAALLIVIGEVRESGAVELLVCYQQSNTAARQLYAQVGFIEQDTSAGVVTARLDLQNAPDVVTDSRAK